MRIASLQYASGRLLAFFFHVFIADLLFTNFTASPKPHAYIYEKSPGIFRGSSLYAQM